MRRIICAAVFIATVLVSALATARAQHAAPTASAKKPFTIFMVTYRGKTDVERGFTDYLANRHVRVRIIERNIALDETKLPGIVAEIKRTKPDLVYTWGTQVTLGIVGRYDESEPSKFVTGIPTVFTLVASPVDAKIVRDLKNPGRDVTGVVHVVPIDQQINAVQSYRPFKRLGVIYTGTAKNSLAALARIEEIGEKQHFDVVSRAFADGPEKKPVAGDIHGMVASLKAEGAEWLYLPADTFLGEHIYEVLAAARDAHIPTFAATEQMVQAGALAGIVSRYYSVGQLTAYKAEQILVKHTPPKNIAVETLTRFSYIVTWPTAEAQGFYPPVELLNYAEIVKTIKPRPKR